MFQYCSKTIADRGAARNIARNKAETLKQNVLKQWVELNSLTLNFSPNVGIKRKVSF